jgi:hypothetical protein
MFHFELFFADFSNERKFESRLEFEDSKLRGRIPIFEEFCL